MATSRRFGARRRPRSLQRGKDSHLRCMNGGREPEEHARDERYAERKRQDRPIELRAEQGTVESVGEERREGARAGGRKRYTGDSAEQREEQALGQQLSDYA